MKILILSCNTGEGHHSAALALQEVLEEQQVSNEIIDPVSFAGDTASEKICDIYNSMIQNNPKAFGFIYHMGEAYNQTFKHSPVYFANSLYVKKLLSYIQSNGFDAVICTHLYGMEAMTAIQKKLNVHIPSYGVLTDYTYIPFFSDTKLDGYFIPHSDLKQDLIQKGFTDTMLSPTGIPTSKRFRNHISKEIARNLLMIPQNKKIYLIMTGGVGCGNISAICDGLLKNEMDDFVAYILAGKNHTLQENLNKIYQNDRRIQCVGFTHKVNEYMNAADVLITKPGGLSSTEAAVANIPLIHYITIPGCETSNAIFFASHGMSWKTENPHEAAKLAVKLVHDENAVQNMCQRQASEINPHAAQEIIRKIIAK